MILLHESHETSVVVTQSLDVICFISTKKSKCWLIVGVQVQVHFESKQLLLHPAPTTNNGSKKYSTVTVQQYLPVYKPKYVHSKHIQSEFKSV